MEEEERIEFRSMTDLPRPLSAILLFPRYNVVIGSFRREQFAILSAFLPGIDAEANLMRQSQLVDRVKAIGLGWFPLFWNWGDEIRRSLFVHRPTMGEVEARCRKSGGSGRRVRPRPTMRRVLALRKEAGLDRFIWGEKGRYMLYDGNPPIPLRTGDRLWIEADIDFIAFRERQGHIVTQPVP